MHRTLGYRPNRGLIHILFSVKVGKVGGSTPLLSTVTPIFASSHGHSLYLVSSSSWPITPSSPTPPPTLLMPTRTLEVSSGCHKIQIPLKTLATLATPQHHPSSHSSPEASLVLLLLLLLLVAREVGYLAPTQMLIPTTPATPIPEEEAYLGSVQIRTPIPATPSNNKERLEQQQEAALYSPIRSANNNNNNPSSNPSSSNRNR